MTALFGEKEKKEAFAEKKKLLIIWFVILGVFVVAEAVMITVNCVLIYTARSRAVYYPFMITSIILSIAFSSFSLFFFSIKYRLTSRYCRMLNGMKFGLKDKGKGKFLEIDPTITEKDGVFFYSLVLDCPPLRRGDITERKILVERTHSLPDFNIGDTIKFITYANMLVAYEKIYDYTLSGAESEDNSETEKTEADEQLEELSQSPEAWL